MPKPNLFIVGAPKSGTTALYYYLRAHPQIFLPERKEPVFFCRDLYARNRTPGTLADYLRIYETADSQCLWVGEASTIYLYSQVAIQNIHEFNPQARIICCFRNPVDASHAFHSEMYYRFSEDVADFEEAWRLQEARSQGLHIPPLCGVEPLLQYRQLMSFPSQLERVYEYFPPEQVKIVLFDDLMADTPGVYQDILKFLGLPSDGRQYFTRENQNREWKWEWLGHMLVKPPAMIRWPVRLYKRIFHLSEVPLRDRLIRRNSTPVERPRLRPEFRAELTAEYADDVNRLARLIGRDLSHWTS